MGDKPETTKPEATKPEATKPETTKPEATKPETTKPETTKPEKKKPEKKKERLSFKNTLKNDVYAIKLGYSITKGIVWHNFLNQVFGYFEWVFFDAFFLREIVNALEAGTGFKPIFINILICTAFFFCTNLYFNYSNEAVFPVLNAVLYGGIYKKIFKKAKNVELSCYEDSDFYNKYTMASDGADERVSLIISNFFGMVVSAVSTVVVFIIMYEIDPFAILFIGFPLIGNFLFGSLKNRAEFKRYEEQAPNDKVLNYVNRAMYLPDYAKEMRLSNIFNLLRSQYSTATENNVRVARKYAFKNAHMNFWRITFTFTAIFEGMLLYGSYRYHVSGTISLAELTVIASLMVAATWILIGLFDNIMVLMKQGMFINNLRGFLEYEEKIPEDLDGIIPDKEFRELRFENVCFSYKDEETIKNLSFTLKSGEIAALVGHNGAGKTTIIKLLLRFYDPSEGAIYLNGINIKQYNLHAYRAMFATTFQDFAIMGMTVRENVVMGAEESSDGTGESSDRAGESPDRAKGSPDRAGESSDGTGESSDGAKRSSDRTGESPDGARRSSDEAVRRALKRAGILEKIDSLPNGLDTMMTKEFDEAGAVFSGGESQKLAVARTFYRESPVKIFDEPSSALDPIAEYRLFTNIMKEGREHTMLFISHRLSSVKSCNRVFMLEKGRLIEEGTHEELMRLGGRYAEMYKKQAMNYLAVDSYEEGAIL